MTVNDLECPIQLKVRFTDGTLGVRLLRVSDSTVRIGVAREGRGSWLEGLAPPPMWAADALFLCGSWASCILSLHYDQLLLTQMILIRCLLINLLVDLHYTNGFLQRVSIACYAERSISYSRFRLTVWPSVTRWYHAKTTPATIVRSSLEDSPMILVSSWLTSARNSKGNIGSEGAEWERGS